MAKKFRLAMVRCDTHGYWYGPFLSKCDPYLLQKNDHEDYYYFSTVRWGDRLRFKPVPGFEIVKCWDADYQRAKDFSHTFLDVPKPCRTVREATEGIDAAFIADCSGDGHDHIKLARPFLEKGILDSTGVLELVAHLESQYGITVETDELAPENLDSIDAVAGFRLRSRVA